MKKVAILFPGLIRTFKKTNTLFIENVINPNKEKYKIDIFLGFWDHTHKRGEAGKRNFVQKITSQEIENVISIYKPKRYTVLGEYEEKNKIYFPSVTEKIIKTIGYPNHPDGYSLIQNGLIAQTYTWSQTYSILEGDYDYLVKSRFDIISDKIDFDTFKDGNFNCCGPDHQFSQYGLADTFFASDTQTMKKIMSDYHQEIINNNIPNISQRYPNVFPEWVLRDYIIRNKININYLDVKTEIVR